MSLSSCFAHQKAKATYYWSIDSPLLIKIGFKSINPEFMGCAQGKPSMNSPPSRVLEKLKLENGYVGIKENGFDSQKRLIGQRHSSSRLLSSDPPDEKEQLDDAKLRDKVMKRDDGADGFVNGWPNWLTDNIPLEVLSGLVPRSAESYDKLDKIGQGTYSNVYKARDRETGKIVALKKVRFDTSESESVKFMAREIMILQKLDHPNIVKLEGLATSRMQYSIYLVFDFMVSDLSRIISRPEGALTEPQVKSYMRQLLLGLQHCHDRGILHRDIKGSNLLIDKSGMLKIADFGLANHYNPKQKRPMTNRVVTLWYRAPELLLGTTDYGVGIDLWSAGCLLAEMFAGRPIMPGRTEVEQLHKIFKLCGTPSEDYWKKLRLSTSFRPPQSYKPCLFEAFRGFPESSLGLLSTLLALDPTYRGSSSSALQNVFFSTRPLPCELSGLPVIYHEEEPPQPIERRNSKMKLRSRTQRERRKKDIAIEKPKEDFVEEPEQIEETNIFFIQETQSSTCSTSPSTKPGSQDENLSFLVSPKQKFSPRIKRLPKASKSFHKLPPLPTSKTGTVKYKMDDVVTHKRNRVLRSASTREFRELNQRKYIEL